MKKAQAIYLAFVTCLFATPVSAAVIGPVEDSLALRQAIIRAEPGDTILMANGAWTDTVIDFRSNGLADQPITLRAEVDGQVTMEGASKLRFMGDYLVVQGLHFTNGAIAGGGDVISFGTSSSDPANHCRLTQCAMTDFNPANPAINYKWVSIYGLHNRVDHCAFTGMNHIGVTLTVWLGTGAPANHTRIDNNFFADRAEGTGNGFETIRIGTSSRSMQESKTLVEGNYFYKCDGEIEIISNKCWGNIYRHNTFESCSGQLTLRHGNECRIEGNFFIGNGVSRSGGVRVIGEDHVVVNNYFQHLRGTGFRAALGFMSGVPDSPLNRYFQVQRALVAFNTFSGCTENLTFGLNADDTELPPLDCVIANNIVEGDDGPLIKYERTPVNTTYEGNLFHGAPLGISQPEGIRLADPLLSTAADGLRRPAAHSPAINAAAGNYPDISTDIDGDLRPEGDVDIGADELASTAPSFKRLGRHDVGPHWMRPSTLSVLGVGLSPFGARIEFEDTTGLAPSYRLERSIDLCPDSWSFVTTFVPVAHTSRVFTVRAPAPTEEKVFWRVARY